MSWYFFTLRRSNLQEHCGSAGWCRRTTAGNSPMVKKIWVSNFEMLEMVEEYTLLPTHAYSRHRQLSSCLGVESSLNTRQWNWSRSDGQIWWNLDIRLGNHSIRIGSSSRRHEPFHLTTFIAKKLSPRLPRPSPSPSSSSSLLLIHRDGLWAFPTRTSFCISVSWQEILKELATNLYTFQVARKAGEGDQHYVLATGGTRRWKLFEQTNKEANNRQTDRQTIKQMIEWLLGQYIDKYIDREIDRFLQQEIHGSLITIVSTIPSSSTIIFLIAEVNLRIPRPSLPMAAGASGASGGTSSRKGFRRLIDKVPLMQIFCAF